LDFSIISIVLQVALIDLLLGGDNAVVIALACRSLPPAMMRKAMLVGTGAAVVMRIILTALLGFLLLLPGLKLLGSVALLIIAVKLIIQEDDAKEEHETRQASSFMDAVALILIADLVMSLDNVVALSAVAQGNLLILIFGLLLSVPLVMFGSQVVNLLLTRFPVLILAGGALLGWVAGEIGSADPLIADWIEAQAPGLALFAAPLGTAYVLLQARIIEMERKKRAEPKKGFWNRPVFCWRSLALVIATLLTAWLCTGVYQVEADELAEISHLGNPVGTVGPGWHYHLPTPIESVTLKKN